MNRLHIAPNRLPIRRAVDKAIDLVREDRALRRAARQMPKPVPWDWAAPRLVPLLSRPAFDPPGEGLVRVTTELGFAVEFGSSTSAPPSPRSMSRSPNGGSARQAS